MMGSTRCPACGQAVGTGSSFCPACGAQLSSVQSYGSPGTLSRMVPLFSGNGYTIEQKILALRDTFGIKDRGGNQLAYVKKQLVSFGPKFWYESTNGEKLEEIEALGLSISERKASTDLDRVPNPRGHHKPVKQAPIGRWSGR